MRPLNDAAWMGPLGRQYRNAVAWSDERERGCRRRRLTRIAKETAKKIRDYRGCTKEEEEEECDGVPVTFTVYRADGGNASRRVWWSEEVRQGRVLWDGKEGSTTRQDQGWIRP